MYRSSFSVILFLVLLIACTKTPVTGRRQLSFIPNAEMQAQSYTAYSEFLQTNKVVPDGTQAAQVKKVGERIKVAVENYMAEQGLSKRLEGFKWEFNLVQDPTVNAWCMPGGKVVFYTGILPICQDENGIAVVMGHEVAHAIAEHGNERMSQQLAAQGLLSLGSAVVQQHPTTFRQILLQAAGAGTQLGLLKFSRVQESEADRMGLIFMALAGYNPAGAVGFWERMSAQAGGQQPPEFLSTHPSHDTRISDLQKWMGEAETYYNRSQFR